MEHASGNSSAVERQPSKLGVAGSNPVSRSTTQTEMMQIKRRATGFPGCAERGGFGGHIGVPGAINQSTTPASTVKCLLEPAKGLEPPTL